MTSDARRIHGEDDIMELFDTASSTGARELAARENDGLHVLLLWHPRSDEVTVSVDDTRTGRYFELPVQRDRALDAFHHPFAYAA
jgi:hypothetical protein